MAKQNLGRVVKGINFINLRDAGDPVEVAAAYDKAGADEVVFLDILFGHLLIICQRSMHSRIDMDYWN